MKDRDNRPNLHDFRIAPTIRSNIEIAHGILHAIPLVSRKLSQGENLLKRTRENAEGLGLKTFMNRYFQFDELPPELAHFLNEEVIPSIISGEKRSVGNDGIEVMKHLNHEVQGLDNIPRSGAALIHPNHLKSSPGNGYTTHYAIAGDVMAWTQRNSRFIMQDGLVFTRPQRLVGKRIPLTQALYRTFNRIYDPILVPPPFLKTKEKASRDSLTHLRESFESEGIVVLYPELEGSEDVKEGHYLAGSIVRAFHKYTRGKGLLLPVGIYMEGEILRSNYGKSYSVSEFDRYFVRSSDENIKNRNLKAVADIMLAKDNLLVPKRMQNPNLAQPRLFY